MSFASVLDSYCSSLNCTNKEIAARCGISPSALSRYRNGEREPSAGGDVLNRLAQGIVDLSNEYQLDTTLNVDVVLSALELGMGDARTGQGTFGKRLDSVMGAVDVRNVDVAAALGVDPSYLSRIRSGQRKPADQMMFAEVSSRIIAQKCIERNAFGDLAAIIPAVNGVARRNAEAVDIRSDLAEAICYWLLDSASLENDVNGIKELFTYLDELDFVSKLQSYAQMGPLPIRTEAFEKPHAEFLLGESGMVQAELLFFALARKLGSKQAALSSDMPIVLYARDDDFLAQYMQGVANLLENGCHISVVHNIDRPLTDTLWTLRQWIPLYVTGQVTPYYLSGVHNRLFYHTNYVADGVALSAEALRGHMDEGRDYVSTKPDDIAYYQRKMQLVLEECDSLLKVYRGSDPRDMAEFKAFEAAMKDKGTGRQIWKGHLNNISIVSYPGECAIITHHGNPTTHFVTRHPKIRYTIAHIH